MNKTEEMKKNKIVRNTKGDTLGVIINFICLPFLTFDMDDRYVEKKTM